MKIGLTLLIVLTGAGIPLQVAMNAKLREAVASPPLTIVIANFGWLGVDKSPINGWKTGGAILLFVSTLMMQKK